MHHVLGAHQLLRISDKTLIRSSERVEGEDDSRLRCLDASQSVYINLARVPV